MRISVRDFDGPAILRRRPYVGCNRQVTAKAGRKSVSRRSEQALLCVSHDALNIDTCDDGGGIVLSLVGELDYATAARLSDTINDVVPAANGQVVLDLTHLSFCDSTGLSVFVGLHKRLAETGGHLAVR